MARHIYIHFHDEQGREPDGRFAAGGSGHAATTHKTSASASKEQRKRQAGLASHGFTFHRAEAPSLNELHNHYRHPDGRTATISAHTDEATGKHTITSAIHEKQA